MTTQDASRTVSIIIPTFNNIRLLAECLTSVRHLNYPAYLLEVVVVDNASVDETATTLRSIFPKVKRVDTGKNAGFAAACNRGAAEASGDYAAFLNDDAVAEPDWIERLFEGLDAGGEGAVCAASHIRSHDGREVEFSGASANIFGVGRPRSAWGWPDSMQIPSVGSPLLFASGGAMLIHRRTFLDAGGFDPNFFAYFEDVDLGWRLWALGHKVVYAPGAVVRHVGGATGSKAGAHRRYALWECNSLAVVLKNWQDGNLERILPAALMLLYKRALLSAGDAFNPADYKLTAPKDTNTTNVERLPKISAAHLAAIDRFNSHLPHFMEERKRIQAARVRSDEEILALLGRAFEVQFAGSEYAQISQSLACVLDLYGITRKAAPNRVLVVASVEEQAVAFSLAKRLASNLLVAAASISGETTGQAQLSIEGGYTRHNMKPDDPTLAGLIEQADAIITFPGTAHLPSLAKSDTPKVIIGLPDDTPHLRGAIKVASADDPRLLDFCLQPMTKNQ